MTALGEFAGDSATGPALARRWVDPHPPRAEVADARDNSADETSHQTATRSAGEGLSPAAYPVDIGPGALDSLSTVVSALGAPASLHIITDQSVDQLYGERVSRVLAPLGRPVRRHVVPAGEAAKSWSTLNELVTALLAHPVGRDSLVIALGGGVVGDLAGFAGAITLRGLPVIQVPTTLLAMVDSAVGGKTGINTPQGKNLVGAFHHPRHVLADTDVLASLPGREWRAGYAEIVKAALLAEADFFTWLEAHGTRLLAGEGPALARAIHRAVAIKAAIVGADAMETTGQRALLNLGHTFAHAFEAEAGLADTPGPEMASMEMAPTNRRSGTANGTQERPGLLHGEAVSVGLVLAAAYSARRGLLAEAAVERVAGHLRSMGLPVTPRDIAAAAPPYGWSASALLARMAGDKKTKGGRLRLVLLRAIGSATLAEERDRDALAAFLAECVAPPYEAPPYEAPPYKAPGSTDHAPERLFADPSIAGDAG